MQQDEVNLQLIQRQENVFACVRAGSKQNTSVGPYVNRDERHQSPKQNANMKSNPSSVDTDGAVFTVARIISQCDSLDSSKYELH
jgi:hypothetical protein